jgi:hypothetical protein
MTFMGAAQPTSGPFRENMRFLRAGLTLTVHPGHDAIHY